MAKKKKPPPDPMPKVALALVALVAVGAMFAPDVRERHVIPSPVRIDATPVPRNPQGEYHHQRASQSATQSSSRRSEGYGFFDFFRGRDKPLVIGFHNIGQPAPPNYRLVRGGIPFHPGYPSGRQYGRY